MTASLELAVLVLVFLFGYVSGLSRERGRWARLFTAAMAGAGLDQAAADLRQRLRNTRGTGPAAALGADLVGRPRQ